MNASFHHQMRAGLIAACLCGVAVGQASAVTAADCDRTTHISHGGEDSHQDLGQGRVMWRDWWSQEGTAKTFHIVDCGLGAALQFRTQEDNMNARPTFDHTRRALQVVARHESGARAFATLDAIARDLDGLARDITLTTLKAEPCACAAFYPDARGDKTEFVLES